MATAEMLESDLQEAIAEIERLKLQRDGAYRERDLCVVLIAKLARAKGYRVGIGKHSDYTDSEPHDKEWSNVLYIDLPCGQVSWHFRDDELVLFEGFPRYEGTYDGHSTEEKYHRVLNPFPGKVVQFSLPFVHHEYTIHQNT